jgi:SAM-dependent methyltransferase
MAQGGTAVSGGDGRPDAGADPGLGACPACGEPLFAWLYAPASDPGSERRYAVDRCERCGLGRNRDLGASADPALYESGAYASARPRLAGAARPLLSAFDRARLRLLRRAATPGARILEVGCGRGRFLARLARAGYRARGIEPSPQRAAEAHELGLEVDQVSLEEARVEPDSQDAVVAWHVLEHLPHPDAALHRIHSWLAPGGALLLGVPNRLSLQAAMGADHWYHLDLPRHAFHYSPPSLETILARNGFEVVRTRHLLLEHNQFGMWQTAMNAITFHDNFLYCVLKRSLTPRTAQSRVRYLLDWLVTIAAGIPAALITVPLELGAGLARRGGTIAVLARANGG